MERITDSPIDERALLDRVTHPAAGAALSFSGVVRNRNAGRDVKAIEYHGYRSMASKEIRRIEDATSERWPGVRAVIVHRLGYMEVGDVSVVIAVSSPHREEGFQALRYTIDELKQTVPIWKKEIYTDGETWIEGS